MIFIRKKKVRKENKKAIQKGNNLNLELSERLIVSIIDADLTDVKFWPRTLFLLLTV